MSANNWWLHPDIPGNTSPRLLAEYAAMTKLFQTDKLVKFNNAVRWDTPFLVKTLSLKLDLGGSQPYWEVKYKMLPMPNTRPLIQSNELFTLQVLYPSAFPGQEPQANYLTPNTDGSPHKYPTANKLCLHHGGPREGWDPALSTASTIASWAVQWARAWLSWKNTSIWPDAST